MAPLVRNLTLTVADSGYRTLSLLNVKPTAQSPPRTRTPTLNPVLPCVPAQLEAWHRTVEAQMLFAILLLSAACSDVGIEHGKAES